MTTALSLSRLASSEVDKRTLCAIHGIQTWSPAGIEAYMQKQVDDYRGNWAWRLQRRLPVKALRKAMGSLFFGVVALAAIGLICFPEASTVGFWLISSGTMAVIFIVDAFIVVDGVAWVEEQKNVASDVPEFVREMMRRVARIFPHHRFVIAELRETRTNAVVDPVLFVEVHNNKLPDGRERIALLVWADGTIVPVPDWAK